MDDGISPHWEILLHQNSQFVYLELFIVPEMGRDMLSMLVQPMQLYTEKVNPYGLVHLQPPNSSSTILLRLTGGSGAVAGWSFGMSVDWGNFGHQRPTRQLLKQGSLQKLSAQEVSNLFKSFKLLLSKVGILIIINTQAVCILFNQQKSLFLRKFRGPASCLQSNLSCDLTCFEQASTFLLITLYLI